MGERNGTVIICGIKRCHFRVDDAGMKSSLLGPRRALGDEHGFTLIELLVVILIIGILAAIAIPSFLNQRLKGHDACAKSMVKQLQTAVETVKTDNNSYAGMTLASVSAVESSITGGACGPGTWVIVQAYDSAQVGCAASGAPNATAFCVGASSESGTNFFIRNSGSTLTRTCISSQTLPHGGCKGNGGNTGSW